MSTSLVDRVFDSRKQVKEKEEKNHALSAWCGIGISKEIKRNHHPADFIRCLIITAARHVHAAVYHIRNDNISYINYFISLL